MKAAAPVRTIQKLGGDLQRGDVIVRGGRRERIQFLRPAGTVTGSLVRPGQWAWLASGEEVHIAHGEQVDVILPPAPAAEQGDLFGGDL